VKVFRGFACLGAGIILASCNQAVPTAGADSVVPANGPTCAPSLVHAPDLVALHAQHPPSMNAPGTLSLNSPKLQQILEPRTSPPAGRLDAVAQLRAAGIPVGVMVAPVIPGINDHEIPAIVAACAKAGAQFAGHVLLRLPWAVAPLFERWLDEHFPERKAKVLERLRHARGGERLYDSRWRKRQTGEGIFAEQIANMFEVACRRGGMTERPKLSIASFRRTHQQLEML